MTLEKHLKAAYSYDPMTGDVVNSSTGNKLNADVCGFVSLKSQDGSKRFKMKLDKLAYFLGTGVLPGSYQKILHKNLDESDNALRNLVLLSSADFKKVKEAVRNLEGAIRIVQHPTDKLAHKVYWFEGGVERSKVIHDIVPARRFETRLKLRFSKILHSYCIFDT